MKLQIFINTAAKSEILRCISLLQTLLGYMRLNVNLRFRIGRREIFMLMSMNVVYFGWNCDVVSYHHIMI